MAFDKESDFEKALVESLVAFGWKEVLKDKSEEELIQNWADILYENNNTENRLNGCPLTQDEMKQILDKVHTLKTPLNLNKFINGKTISIKRENPKDTKNLGNEINLKIYDRHEIAGGESKYQIAQQPRIKNRKDMLNDRRPDLMLLINGMPLIHIELKNSKVDISEAINQIKKYTREDMFTGIFSLVQIFVAMKPEDCIYFANPGSYDRFNEDYFFHWADKKNKQMNEWQDIVKNFLRIPMAHQLIGFYTIADDTDDVLKVMRSYQYHATKAITDEMKSATRKEKKQYGGYIWHTTGSGKTMTSFKSAQLIANSDEADKVIFLVDRIELGTQSLREYQGFAEDDEIVQDTHNTKDLLRKLKSSDVDDVLIITSIHKMSRISEDMIRKSDIEAINTKRIVFIIDECHRSTFGKMLITIKKTFPGAIFFGFTGTPIHDENQKNKNTTADVFGDELHRYSIADGIRDKNVLGFDIYKILTYKDEDLKREICLRKCNMKKEEINNNDKKTEKYRQCISDIKMVSYKNEKGKIVKGVEDLLPKNQYRSETHRDKVVEDIINVWDRLSRGGEFHAIFATSSISEAIQYYDLFQSKNTGLNIAALFDQNIDNKGERALIKEDAIVRMLEDYNKKFGLQYDMKTYSKYKKDISVRLAHKEPYTRIKKEEQLDILIVVDQMLTGYDSKYINTLYLDKVLEDEHIIQAFSRTNRLFNPTKKPYGTIRYYRKPHTMEKKIEKAIMDYSGNDKPMGIKVLKLDKNIKEINEKFDEIKDVFKNAGIMDFGRLPSETAEKGKFAVLFDNLNQYLIAAEIQGLVWEKREYEFDDIKISINLDKQTYLILVKRYQELSNSFDGDSGDGSYDMPFEIKGYLNEIPTGQINIEYMNKLFQKMSNSKDNEEIQNTKDGLYKEVERLYNEEDQKIAKIVIDDVISKRLISIEELPDLIFKYKNNIKKSQIAKLSKAIGVDETALYAYMEKADRSSMYGKEYADVADSIDLEVAKKYFNNKKNKSLANRDIIPKARDLLWEFIKKDGFDIDDMD